MFITLGDRTVNTDHITSINWDAETDRWKNGKKYGVPCVMVYLSTISGESGFFSAECFALYDYQAAQLATWFKSSATDLNMMTPDADFLRRYPKAETLEPVETPKPQTSRVDELPF